MLWGNNVKKWHQRIDHTHSFSNYMNQYLLHRNLLLSGNDVLFAQIDRNVIKCASVSLYPHYVIHRPLM